MRVLVVWWPDWPVVSLGLSCGDPVAVMEANVVAATSPAARATGVAAGQRRREAEALCAGLLTPCRDRTAEARAFEPVVAALGQVTPLVEVVRPGLCAFGARGPARYFGGEQSLICRVAEAVGKAGPGEAGPAVGIGVAEGYLAAALAARGGEAVPAAATRAFLAPFPVSVLGQPKLATLLGRLGIHTLGDLARLPEPAVLSRFGPKGRWAHGMARGEDARLLAAGRPADPIVAEIVFDPPAERSDTAAFAARSLAADLVLRLDGADMACTRLRIEVETEHGESLVRLWRGEEQQLDEEQMVARVRWQLDGWLSGSGTDPPPTAGIARLCLAADETVPARSRQLGFWGGRSDRDRRAARGADRVLGMLGDRSVFTGMVQGGRYPDERVALLAWGEQSTVERPDVGLPWPGRLPAPAPGLVHAEPVPIRLCDPGGGTVTVDGRGQVSSEPRRLSIRQGRWVEVVSWAGPWLADQRWWDASDGHRRARLQLVTGNGVAHLCFVEKGRWWLEGTYD